jgi:tRNA A-37 threonylcarbamoyl transferase component Bud32
MGSPLLPGTRLGRYEIRSQLGAGGMGEVYLARDTKLGRDVAVKVLRSSLVRDTQLRQRMEREAHAVSSLNHPHICALYDVGHQDSTDFLVMEYLEGESLADRLLRGSLPVEQVLRYGVEILDALDKAHRQGIVHRDLKPGNIMLTKLGTKLLDFGLAKLQPPKSEAGVLSELPTEHLNITAEGTIPGTLQYMAPEQLEGGHVDARSDIFAFGTVLYEMATGHKAFDGKSPASLIASIMHTDPPPVSTLQPMTPPAFDRVVRTCLAKDPDERFQTAHDVGLQMKWIVEGGSQAGVSAPVVVRRKVRERALVAAALVLFITTIALAILYFRRPQEEAARAVRFLIAPTERETFAGGMISPDGHRLVINVWDSSGTSMLWVRPLDSINAQPLPGTDSAGSITNFWSRDSCFIGFFSGGKLKRVDATGGPPQMICDAPNGVGGAWNQDGVIIFAPDSSGGLYRVPASGGAPAAVTSLDESRQEISHRWPVFLPDGKHFLYLVQSSQSDNTGIFVGALDSKETTRLLSTIAAAAYAPPGYLLFMRERTLMAQAFDANKLQFTGEPFPSSNS